MKRIFEKAWIFMTVLTILFAITATTVNETPTTIALPVSSLNQNSGFNTTMGAVSITDPELAHE